MGSGAGGALGRGRAGLSVASLDLVHSTNKASLRGRGAATGGDGGLGGGTIGAGVGGRKQSAAAATETPLPHPTSP